MEKQVKVLTVTYAPGRHGASIDVQPVLIDDDGAEIPLGNRETVETSQPELQKGKGNWGDADVERVVREAKVEVEPAVEAKAAVEDEQGNLIEASVKAKAAVTKLRFPDVTIVY